MDAEVVHSSRDPRSRASGERSAGASPGPPSPLGPNSIGRSIDAADDRLRANEFDDRELGDGAEDHGELEDLEALVERLEAPGAAHAHPVFGGGADADFARRSHSRRDPGDRDDGPRGGEGRWSEATGRTEPGSADPASRTSSSIFRGYIVLSLTLLVLAESLVDALTRSGPLGPPARWLLLALQHPVRSPLALLLLALALRPSPLGRAPHAGPKHGAGL